MEIDIISYTDEQYAALTTEQIQEVKSAQVEKNELDKALEEALEREKLRLSARGLLLSGLWELYSAKLTAEHDEKVNELREALLFYLRFTTQPEDTAAQEAPYVVNYAYTIEERLEIVRKYYETTYTDAAERFAAFKEDEVAPLYLGEEYAALYDYYLALAG